MEITVYTAKFHGSDIIYRGKSEKQAIKIARIECGSRWVSVCGCGGAVIRGIDENGTVWQLYQWEAAKPGRIAQERFWVEQNG